MSNYIFRARTDEALHLRILADILSNNLKTAYFEIDKKVLRLRMYDSNDIVLIDTELTNEFFSIYQPPDNKIYMGLNLNHFHKMLKDIKNKDTVELLIEENNPSELIIKIISKEKNKGTITSNLKIQNIQHLDIDLPTNFTKHITMPSSNYRKMIKVVNINNIIEITYKDNIIEFACDGGGIRKRKIDFGELDTRAKNNIEHKYTFDLEYLSRITKISSLSQNLQIYNGPIIKLESNVGTGTGAHFTVYIKSREQMPKNSATNDNAESDSDEE